MLKLETAQSVVRVTLDRPDKRNALTRELLQELREAVDSVCNDDSVRLLVLTGAGPVFCAGMDLGQMQQRAESPKARQEWRQDTSVYRDVLWNLFRLPIPTLAVVQGPVVAGGMGLVLACDMVLAAESAFFSLPEPKRGINAAVVVPLLLYRVGPGRAGYLLLSGRNVSAHEAHRMGLCHEVVSADSLPGAEQELTESILTGAPAALAMTKRHLIDCAGASLTDQLDAGMQISAQARETPDAREGLAAFLEKRTPDWVP